MIKNYFKYIFIISLPLIFFSQITFAQVPISLNVAPHTFDFQVFPGEKIENKIMLANPSPIAIPILVKVLNFGAAGEDGEINFFESNEDISINLAKWIKIENPNFILEPDETEKINFSIEVPENAEPGGKYATVLLEPQLPSFYFEKGATKVIPNIGVLFLVSVRTEGLKKPEEPLTILEFTIPESLHLKKLENSLASIFSIFFEIRAAEKEIFTIVETSQLPFSLRIKNNDIYHLKPEGKLVISRIPLINTNIKLINTNKIVGEIEIQKTTILPGKIRAFPVEFKPELPEKLIKYLPVQIANFFSQNLFIGKYRAHLLLTIENDKIEKEIEFWIFPWKTVLTSSLTLIGLFLLRKRILTALKVLIKIK